jgi:hypothetical protein
VGTHTITASYSGDANLGSSVSPPVSETITGAPAGDFSLTGPPSVTFHTQSSASAALTLLSLNGFSATISITCNPPLPINYLCTVNPTSVVLSANGNAQTTFTLQPNLSASNTLPPHQRSFRIVLASLVPLTLLSLMGLGRRRRTLRTFLSLALLSVLTSAITACGPNQFIAATPPGTYPITFTATGTNQGSGPPTVHTATVIAILTP